MGSWARWIAEQQAEQQTLHWSTNNTQIDWKDPLLAFAASPGGSQEPPDRALHRQHGGADIRSAERAVVIPLPASDP
jgi:hypothetical protein